MAEQTTFRAGLIQLRSGRDVAANLEAAEAGIREAAAGGADYVLTPENTALMELDRKRLAAHAEPSGETRAIARFRDLARALGIWLHIGATPVHCDGERLTNRSILIDPGGRIVARYDKIHMFDVDLPGGETYRESATFESGGRAVLADLPWGRVGLTICYDLRFPALYRALAKAGADFITVPSAFTRQTGMAHWHILLRARAIETGCFVLAAAQGGHHEVDRDTYGHSLIVSPWGEILTEAGIDPTVVFADIDPHEVIEARRRIPALGHDRLFEI